MFTGIVMDVGRVASIEPRGTASVLAIERPLSFVDLRVGESIAVSGICLTVLPEDGGLLRFDVSPETLSRSTLGALRRGDRVNLERALAMGDRFGGHIVAGHVDATTAVVRMERSGDFWTFTFELGRDWARYVIEKGSIALDGVSLTVAAVRDVEFDVAVIPHTFAATSLGGRSPGDRVNMEVDLLGKYVESLLGGRARVESTALDARLEKLLSSPE